MKKPAVFVDRDGTINEQMGYINHVSRFKIIPGVPQAIRMLNRQGFLVLVVSNQSGVARGYYPMDLVETIHHLMVARIKEKKAVIDGVFFCPHHPAGSVPEFSRECECRKPKTGLIEQACKSFEIDLRRSFVVGDMCTDIELAHRAGLKGVLVKTGYGLGEIEYLLPRKTAKPSHIAEDLLDAVRWIVTGGDGDQSLNKTSQLKENHMAISKELLDILACPKCKGDIYLNEAGNGLICDKCKLLYEIKDDIPIMLIDEAKPLP